MELIKIDVVFLLLSYCCMAFCFPSRPLNERSTELAWEAWLLVDDQNKQTDPNSPPKSRITPKSVFIAPTFSPENLPSCGEGYRKDSGTGGCMQIIKLDHKENLEFILANLNDKFGELEYEYESLSQESSSNQSPGGGPEGPLQFNIPLSGDQSGMEEGEESGGRPNVAIIVAPSSTGISTEENNSNNNNQEESEELDIIKRTENNQQQSNNNVANKTGGGGGGGGGEENEEVKTTTVGTIEETTFVEESTTLRPLEEEMTTVTEEVTTLTNEEEAATTTIKQEKLEETGTEEQHALFFLEQRIGADSSSSSASSSSPATAGNNNTMAANADRNSTEKQFQTADEEAAMTTISPSPLPHSSSTPPRFNSEIFDGVLNLSEQRLPLIDNKNKNEEFSVPSRVRFPEEPANVQRKKAPTVEEIEALIRDLIHPNKQQQQQQQQENYDVRIQDDPDLRHKSHHNNFRPSHPSSSSNQENEERIYNHRNRDKWVAFEGPVNHHHSPSRHQRHHEGVFYHRQVPDNLSHLFSGLKKRPHS